VTSPATLAGECLGRLYGLRGTDLGVGLGRKRSPTSGTVEAGGGGRWSLGSGEPAVRLGQHKDGGAIGDPSGGKSKTSWCLRRPEGDARHGRTGGWQRTEPAKGSVRARGGNSGFL
jgi:hypothetical protein